MSVKRFVLMILISCSLAQNATAISIDQGFQSGQLEDEALLIEDPESSLTIELVRDAMDQFKKPKTLSMGHTKSAYWMMFPLTNPADSAAKVYFEYAYPLLDEIEVYLVNPENEVSLLAKTGDSVKKDQLPLKYVNPVVPIELPSRASWKVISRIKTTSSMNLRATVRSEKSFLSNAIGKIAINCLYYGAVLALLSYNFSLYLSLREVTFLYYVLFIASGILVFISWGGIGGAYIWDEAPALTSLILNFGIIHMSAWATMFSRVFLNVRQYFPRIDRCLLALFWLGIGGSPFCTPLDASIGVYIGIVYLSSSAIILITVGVFVKLRGERVANFYLGAWTVLLLAGIYSSLAIFQVIEQRPFTFAVTQLGSALESLLLSFGLGYRFNLLKREKYLVERTLNESLSAKLHSYQQLEKVFYNHQIELIKQGRSLEETMPTEGNTAAVIAFDIIDSSKLIHEGANVFMRNVFHRCYQSMMENYDPISMTANAYRIKELGDGFLCSVGYPFKTPNEERKSIIAMKLVDEFQKIFQEEVAKLDFPLPVYFGVGIALGDIKGFYPAMGPREYDLFGNSIVLATRYESMRKELFKTREKSSIIIVQERFFYSLTAEYRQEFQCLDLSTVDFRVRDDPSAERLYFCPLHPQAKSRRSEAA